MRLWGTGRVGVGWFATGKTRASRLVVVPVLPGRVPGWKGLTSHLVSEVDESDGFLSQQVQRSVHIQGSHLRWEERAHNHLMEGCFIISADKGTKN